LTQTTNAKIFAVFVSLNYSSTTWIQEADY